MRIPSTTPTTAATTTTTMPSPLISIIRDSNPRKQPPRSPSASSTSRRAFPEFASYPPPSSQFQLAVNAFTPFLESLLLQNQNLYQHAALRLSDQEDVDFEALLESLRSSLQITLPALSSPSPPSSQHPSSSSRIVKHEEATITPNAPRTKSSIKSPNATSSKSVRFDKEHFKRVCLITSDDSPSTIVSCPQFTVRDPGVIPPEEIMWKNEIRLGNFTLPNSRLNSASFNWPPVLLESVELIADVCLRGTILVQNLAYHKQVTVRYSTDGWRSFREVEASYMGTSSPSALWMSGGFKDSTYDQFEFMIEASEQFDRLEQICGSSFPKSFAEEEDDDLPLIPGLDEIDNNCISSCDTKEMMAFACQYEVNGESYWDSNDGLNYEILFSRQPFVAATPNVTRETKSPFRLPPALNNQKQRSVSLRKPSSNASSNVNGTAVQFINRAQPTLEDILGSPPQPIMKPRPQQRYSFPLHVGPPPTLPPFCRLPQPPIAQTTTRPPIPTSYFPSATPSFTSKWAPSHYSFSDEDIGAEFRYAMPERVSPADRGFKISSPKFARRTLATSQSGSLLSTMLSSSPEMTVMS